MQKRLHKSLTGFTLIELLVVISIIGVLASVVLASTQSTREKGRAASAVVSAKALARAAELYNAKMNFYPPDVGRGWDPGFMQPLPFNPDTGASIIPVCAWCPPGWDTLASQQWDGPYLSSWPRLTPWNGKYDYNYWATGTVRYGCSVPAGVYIGIQRDYADINNISTAAEQWMLDQKTDSDGCLNGEAQILLFRL